MGIVSVLKYGKSEESGFDREKFLAEYYATYESKAGFTQKKTFAPSTIGYGHGKCARYWYLAFNGADFEDTATPKAKAAMENGTFTHDRIQARLSKMNKNYKVINHESEIVIDSPPIRGFRDSLIFDVENNVEIPFEIKSMKDDKFIYKQSSEKPEPQHLLQLLIYMKQGGHKTGVFFYENKNDQSYLVIPINMDEKNTKLINEVWDWLRKVYKAYEDNTLPERTFTKSQWACKGCPVNTVCWKDMKNEEGEVYIEPLVLAK